MKFLRFRRSHDMRGIVVPLLNRALIIHANAHDQAQGLMGRYHNTTLDTK
jgi:hypothetical protein